MRITIWNEGVHEQVDPAVAARYPEASTAPSPTDCVNCCPGRPSHGHARHRRRARALRGSARPDRRAAVVGPRRPRPGPRRGRGARPLRVLGGMGLHGAPLRPLLEDLHLAHGHDLLARMAQRGRARTRLDGQPSHPIARGVEHPLVIDQQEMYGELFDIPAPDELVFISSFAGGKCSAPAAPSRADGARSSTSARVTRRTRSTSTRVCGECWPTLSNGRRLSTARSCPSSATPHGDGSSGDLGEYAGRHASPAADGARVMVSLDGAAGFAFDDQDRGVAERWFAKSDAFDRTISLPFSPESPGVGHRRYRSASRGLVPHRAARGRD